MSQIVEHKHDEEPTEKSCGCDEHRVPTFKWFFYTYPEQKLVIATRGAPLELCSDQDIRIHDENSGAARVANLSTPVRLDSVQFVKVIDRVINKAKKL